MTSAEAFGRNHRDPTEGGVPALRIGLVGFGAIGSVVGNFLIQEQISGVTLGGVLDPICPPESFAVRDLDELIETNDVIVEAAGPRALSDAVAPVLEASKLLVAVSIGAFLSPELQRFVRPGATGGRLVLTTGAIAGLDLVRAARMADGAASVKLRSTKKPSALVQPWMSEDERAALKSAGEPRTLFQGSAIEAARLFPQNLNVAAALAIAAGDVNSVEVELVADPRAQLTRHDIRIRSALGKHRLELENLPSPENAATSGLVPWAVLRCLSELPRQSAVLFR